MGCQQSEEHCGEGRMWFKRKEISAVQFHMCINGPHDGDGELQQCTGPLVRAFHVPLLWTVPLCSYCIHRSHKQLSVLVN